MTWVLLAFASACLIGAYEVARKLAVADNAPLPVLLTATLGGLALLLPLPALSSWSPAAVEPYGLAIQPLPLSAHCHILLKASIVTTSWVLAYSAVKHLPISISGPLRASSPIFTVLGALILFRETPSFAQWAGMAVIFLGYWGFALLGPKEGIHFRANRWIALLVLGTAVGALSGLYDKHLLQRVLLPPTTLQFWFTLYNATLQGLLVLWFWRRQPNRTPYRFTWMSLAVGVLLVLADQLYFRALAMPDALVSVVSLTRRSSVLVSFTVGGLLLREPLLKKKLAPLGLVLLGVLILLFGRA